MVILYANHEERLPLVKEISSAEFSGILNETFNMVTTVPMACGLKCGYIVFASDTGLIDDEPLNEFAGMLTGYPAPLHGDVIIASLRETGDDALASQVDPAIEKEFEAWMHKIVTLAKNQYSVYHHLN